MSFKYDALVEVQTRLKTLSTFNNAVNIGLINRVSGKACIFLGIVDSENTDDEFNEFNILVRVFHTSSNTKKATENILTDEEEIIKVIEDDDCLGGACAWVTWEKTHYAIDLQTMYINGMDMEFKIKLVNY